MVRKLKTYQTSIGFYDLAVAAPSMKAALEIWGADSNLFHQGFAKETHDPEIVSATIATPGIVLRRPVGTNGALKETSGLPTNLTNGRVSRERPKRRVKAATVDDARSRKAAEMFDRQQRKRDEARRKEAAARQKSLKRRTIQIAKAQAALDSAEADHKEKTAVIQSERDAIERRADAESQRWDRQRATLEAALTKAKARDIRS
jgi:colicin import membrane protein